MGTPRGCPVSNRRADSGGARSVEKAPVGALLVGALSFSPRSLGVCRGRPRGLPLLLESSPFFFDRENPAHGLPGLDHPVFVPEPVVAQVAARGVVLGDGLGFAGHDHPRAADDLARGEEQRNPHLLRGGERGATDLGNGVRRVSGIVTCNASLRSCKLNIQCSICTEWLARSRAAAADPQAGGSSAPRLQGSDLRELRHLGALQVVPPPGPRARPLFLARQQGERDRRLDRPRARADPARDQVGPDPLGRFLRGSRILAEIGQRPGSPGGAGLGWRSCAAPSGGSGLSLVWAVRRVYELLPQPMSCGSGV